MDKERIENAVREILAAIGEDPQRPGLVETPRRVAAMYAEVFSGMTEDAHDHLKVFQEEGNDGLVVVRDIPLYSMCEHHLLPFIGKAHVAYIPDRHITGLSKIARCVEVYARRLQVQERLTVEIRDCIEKALSPLGVAVVIEATHTCMCMRGVQKSGALTTTSAFSGAFLRSEKTRNEFLNLIKK